MAETLLTVLNPVGYPPRISPQALAPRLDSLDGKTVYLVDCRFDDSALLLEQLQAWFAEHLPRVTTRLVQLSSVYLRDDPCTWEEIRDALGVG